MSDKDSKRMRGYIKRMKDSPKDLDTFTEEDWAWIQKNIVEFTEKEISIADSIIENYKERVANIK